MQFPEPIPFKEAIGKLADREITPSILDSNLWAQVPVAIRERAFFSATVESARVLQSMKDYTTEYLSNSRYAPTSHDTGALVASGRSEFVADMRELAIREGLGHVDPDTGKINPHIRESDLTDIRSIARLQLIFDTQTEAAHEYGYFTQGQDPAILDVFPAQRFIRVRPVKAPRSYHEPALGEVRLKDDLKFWLNLNRDFNVPWGPWGYNSGCGVEDVDRNEAESLGILKKNAVVKPIEKEFNEGLQASARNLDPGLAAALRRTTGGDLSGGTLVAPAAAAPMPVLPPSSTSVAEALSIVGITPHSTLTPVLAKSLIDEFKENLPAKAMDKVLKIFRAPKVGVLTRTFLADTMQEMVDFLPPQLVDILPDITIHVKSSMGTNSGTYCEKSHVLCLSKASLSDPKKARKTLFHELLHWVHDHAGPAYETQVKELFDIRTAGESEMPLRPWNRRDILGKRDKWLDADGDEYAGRIYDWEKRKGAKGSEVVTRHLEKLADPDELARHWNHQSSDGSYHWREAFLKLIHILYP